LDLSQDVVHHRPSAPLVLTERADYALRSVLYLSRSNGAFVPAETVAGHYGMSTKMLAEVLRRLRVAGILTSKSGSHGGFKLSRPAESIAVRSVIAAVDGSNEFAPPPVESTTGTRDLVDEFWRSLDTNLQRILDGFSVADLASERSLI
jgi:Rrf2 family protein